MKRYFILSTVTLLFLGFTSSCNNWLDVPVDGKFTAKELFTTGDGYRSALNSLYKNMGAPVLYGKNLQFGILDFFSNQYDMSTSYMESYSSELQAAGKRDFEEPNLRRTIDHIWLSAYKIIAAANDLAGHIEQEDNNKFAGGEAERKLIWAEAKAIRAFLHFDMLRLYAPAPVNDTRQPYIPYNVTFPETQGRRLPVKEVLDLIIKDLEEAKILAQKYDSSPEGMIGITSGDARFYNDFPHGFPNVPNPKDHIDAFFQTRGCRFNSWSITALLARVYQYYIPYDQNMTEKAKTSAKEVIELTLTGGYDSKIFPFKDEWFNFKYIDNPEMMRDIRMVSNLIMALHNEKQLEMAMLENSFPRDRGRGLSISNLPKVNLAQDIFKTTEGVDEFNTDMRAQRLLYQPEGMWNVKLSTKWYIKKDEQEELKRTIRLIPLIRTSELRYIIAECEAVQGNYAEAYRIVNEMRSNRMLETPLPVKNTLEGFIKDLVREAQREWISEGQLFYLYKRLNAPVKRSETVTEPFKNEECVLPLPAKETI